MEIDAVDWRNLEAVEAGNVLLDSRSALDKVRLPGFLKLYARGYCTLVETGPGDSVHIFSLTQAGKEALDARRRG
jgi:hypothetical protein